MKRDSVIGLCLSQYIKKYNPYDEIAIIGLEISKLIVSISCYMDVRIRNTYLNEEGTNKITSG